MISSPLNATSTALSGLRQADDRVTTDAGNIAGGGDAEASMVDITASKSEFQANAQVLKVADSLNKRLLDIFA